jgi:hypothetical protein
MGSFVFGAKEWVLGSFDPGVEKHRNFSCAVQQIDHAAPLAH